MKKDRERGGGEREEGEREREEEREREKEEETFSTGPTIKFSHKLSPDIYKRDQHEIS